MQVLKQKLTVPLGWLGTWVLLRTNPTDKAFFSGRIWRQFLKMISKMDPLKLVASALEMIGRTLAAGNAKNQTISRAENFINPGRKLTRYLPSRYQDGWQSYSTC